jgi:hypothetical protein
MLDIYIIFECTENRDGFVSKSVYSVYSPEAKEYAKQRVDELNSLCEEDSNVNFVLEKHDVIGFGNNEEEED